MKLTQRARLGWQWCHRTRTSAIVTWATAAGLMLVGVAWRMSSSSFVFELDPRTLGRQDIAALTNLADDLGRTVAWQPSYVRPDQVQLLADWIKHPGNAGAEHWEQLYRSDSREFAALNGMVMLLKQQTDASVKDLRDKEPQLLVAELARRLDQIAEKTRLVSLNKLTAQPQNHELVQRLRLPLAPRADQATAGFLGRFSGRSAGSPRDWAKALVAAVDARIRPVELRYRAMETAELTSLGDETDLQLALKPLISADTGRRTLVYAADRSTSDWEVWVRIATPINDSATTQRLEWDTGLRLVCVPWTKDASTSGFRPAWPSGDTNVGCELPRLNEFLHEIGLPRALDAASGTATLGGDASSPTINLRFELGSPQFPEWRYAAELPLPATASEAWFADVVQSARAARGNLRTHILGLKQYCGCEFRCVGVEGDERTLAAVLQHAQWGELHLTGVLDDDGRLRWLPLPAFEDRVRLTQQLIASRPDLKGLEGRLVLSAVQLFPAESRVDVRWKLKDVTPPKPTNIFDDPKTAKPSEAAQAIVWSARGESASPKPQVSPEAVQLAADAKKAADATAAANPTASGGDPRVSAAELESAARDHLTRTYAKLSRSARLAVTPTNGGVMLQIGLTISDWPELALGPTRATTVEETRVMIDQLLSKDSVAAAIRDQWHGEDGLVAHPRYGQIRCELTSWTPASGHATVKCVIKLPHVGELDWAEQTESTLDGKWSRLDEVEVANQLRPDIEGALELAQSEMIEWIGLPDVGRLEIDPTGIEGDRWLSLNPPRVALRCWASIPYLGGLRLQAGRCWLERSGIQAPREVGIVIPGTLPLHYFALDGVSISLAFRDRGLRVGGKVTPPVPPGPGPNPWLQVGYTELNVGGELNKSGWSAPKLRGTGDITVAGKSNVSHGSLGVDFGSGNVDGDFIAKAPLPGMSTVPARLDGQLAYRGSSHAFDMAGRGTLLEEDIANLNFQMGRQEHTAARPFDLAGRVRVPYVASVVVRGDAANKMDAFTLKGKGSAGPFTCRFKATEEGIETETGVTTSSGGTVYVSQWDPSLVTLNTEDPAAKEQESAPTKLKSWAEGVPNRQASESEQQFARNRVTIELDAEDIAGDEGERRSAGDVENPYRTFGESALKGDENAIVVMDPATKRLLCRIPADPYVDPVRNVRRFRFLDANKESIELNNKGGYVLVMEWRGRGGGEVLICQPDQDKWARVTFAADQSSSTPVIQSLSSQGLGTGRLDPDSPDYLVQAGLYWQTLKMGFEIGVGRSLGQDDFVRPKPLAHGDLTPGFSVDFSSQVRRPGLPAPPVHRRWLWLEGQSVVWLDLLAPYVVRDWESQRDFVEAVKSDERELRAMFPGKDVPRRLAYASPPSSPGDGSRTHGWSCGWIVRTKDTRDGDLLVWRHADGFRQLLLAAHAMSEHDLFTRSSAALRAAMAEPEFKGRKAWLGPAGLFCEDETRFWLVADRGAEPPECGSLSRKAWLEWPGEHRRFLPRTWQAVEARRAVTDEQLAEAVLRDWSVVRGNPDDFQVQPLGLFLLAGREERASDGR